MLSQYENLIRYPSQGSQMKVVFNIHHKQFHTIRNGDLIALMNVVEHLRRRDCNQTIQFHVCDDALHNTDYCRRFRSLMLDSSDYLSRERGTADLPVSEVSLWNYRGAVGDLVGINNPRKTEKKIALFPLLDAAYNTYRNWPMSVLREIIDHYSGSQYDGYQRILCSQFIPPVDSRSFYISRDFIQNMRHAMEAEVYVGGDTGVSHFVGALARGPQPVYVCHGQEGRIHTLPFHFSRKGRFVLY